MEISKNVVDKWGIPVPHITATWHENEFAMYSEIRNVAAEMLEACGCRNVATWGDARPSPPGKGIHEMGTARMGNDPRTSVLNKWNQSHDIKNLFILCLPKPISYLYGVHRSGCRLRHGTDGKRRFVSRLPIFCLSPSAVVKELAA